MLALVTVVGLGVGAAGAALVCLLHLVQHGAYGYDVGNVLDTESFLEGVSRATPLRRFCVPVVGGFVAGLGWWALQRFGRPLVNVEEVVDAKGRMPPGSTIVHVLLQIVTVGIGSPLGRETAPRELGATFSTWVSDRARLSPEQRRLLVACAAGAGLAAVYNVPFGGALFTLEVLLGTFRPSAVAAAVASSALAAVVVKVALGNVQVYHLPLFEVHAGLLVWSVLAGPVLGLAADQFARLAGSAREHTPRGVSLLLWCVPTFVAVGLFATRYPQLLGNGKNAAQPAINGELTIGLAAVLVVLRLAITVGSLRAGAKGGLLTPSLAIGALLATLLGAAWSQLWPGTPLPAFAVVGATAFLAVSQKMPVTAIVLMGEFTRFDHDTLFAVLLCVAGASAVARAEAKRGFAVPSGLQ
jgi:H+/Cl- antiporter ClcA